MRAARRPETGFSTQASGRQFERAIRIAVGASIVRRDNPSGTLDQLAVVALAQQKLGPVEFATAWAGARL